MVCPHRTAASKSAADTQTGASSAQEPNVDYLTALAPIAVFMALLGAVMRSRRIARPPPPLQVDSPAPATGGGRGVPRCGP